MLGAPLLLATAAASNARADQGLFVEARVAQALPDRPVIVLNAGRNNEIALNHTAVVIRSDRLIGAGRVFLTEPNRSAVRLAWLSENAAAGDLVLVLQAGLPAVCRVALPEGTTLITAIDRLAPGHRTAWLTHGRQAGIVLGDSFLVKQADQTVGLAEVIETYPRQVLVRVNSFSPSASVRQGDPAVLWPSPHEQRTGRVSVPVLTVTASGKDQHVWLPGGPGQGLKLDRRVEILRNGRFVATALVDRPAPTFTRATTVEAYTREPVKPGDKAVLLSDPPGPGHIGRVFLVDKDYYLISVGEDVGIRRGQKLLALRDGELICRLVVQTVKQSYSGATRDPDRAPSTRPKPWDEVWGTDPPDRQQRLIGRVNEVILSGRFATARSSQGTELVEPGTLVRVGGRGTQPTAAMAIHKSHSSMILHIPTCWTARQIRAGEEIYCTPPATNSD